jgi:hypothetical protein
MPEDPGEWHSLPDYKNSFTGPVVSYQADVVRDIYAGRASFFAGGLGKFIGQPIFHIQEHPTTTGTKVTCFLNYHA